MMSSNPQIVDTETLAEMSGFNPRSHKCIEKWCEDEHIRYFSGINGPYTTLDLLNAAKGLVPLSEEITQDIL